MEKVLVITGGTAAAESLCTFVRESGAYARTIIAADPSWELVMINIPLPDEQGLELAQYAAENTAAGCIVMVKPELADRIMQRADQSGLIVVRKPFSSQALYQIVRAVDAAIRRSYELYEETVRLERRITEIQTIDKAKFRLMEYREMTEEEAHSYIEQYAMKNRKKKVIAAAEIIEKIEEQYL